MIHTGNITHENASRKHENVMFEPHGLTFKQILLLNIKSLYRLLQKLVRYIGHARNHDCITVLNAQVTIKSDKGDNIPQDIKDTWNTFATTLAGTETSIWASLRSPTVSMAPTGWRGKVIDDRLHLHLSHASTAPKSHPSCDLPCPYPSGGQSSRIGYVSARLGNDFPMFRCSAPTSLLPVCPTFKDIKSCIDCTFIT
jgi:hypothetical protein